MSIDQTSQPVKPLRIAVLVSGSGSNLKNLINHSLKENSKFKITLVISNNPKAKGLNYTKEFKIKKKIINYSNIKNGEKEILIEFENQGGTSKKHSPKSQGFFSKLKEVWEDLT